MNNSGEFFDLYMDDTRENLNLISREILLLEKEPDNEQYVNDIFRAAHTIKGSAATMEFQDIADVTHKVEDLFSAIRDHKLNVTKEVIDVVFKSLDCLESLHDKLEDDSISVDMSVLDNISSILSGSIKNTNSNNIQIPKDNTLNLKNNSTYNENMLRAMNPESKFYTEYIQKSLMTDATKDSIKQFIDSDYKVYYAAIKIDDECQYKTARTYMVYECLSSISEIIGILPSMEEIEKEDFNGSDIDILMVSSEDIDTIRKTLDKILEIEVSEILSVTKSHIFINDNDSITANDISNKNNESKIDNNNEKVIQEEKKSINQNSPNKDANTGGTIIKVHTKTLDILANLEGELLLENNRLRMIMEKLKRNNFDTKDIMDMLEDISGNIGKVLQSQQQIIMSARMFPLDQLFQLFPRMVRDLSSSLGKKVDLEIKGEDTKLDRTILEKVTDPLKHILRNAVDHGIETPEERLASGKSETGTVRILAKQESNSVIITVSDDGHGIDTEVIKKKAIKKGMYTEEELAKFSKEEILNIIFLPGFSTSEKVTEVSGRGVGMDIVRSHLAEIGGIASIETEIGKGSTFIVKIPLTLAISKSLLTTIDKENFIILMNYVIDVHYSNRATEIKSVQTNEHVIIRDTVYPLIYLRDVYGYERKPRDIETIVLVQSNGKVCGIVVDDVPGEQDIVVKSVNKYFKNIKYVSGLTKFGDGSIPVIADVSAIVKDYLK